MYKLPRGPKSALVSTGSDSVDCSVVISYFYVKVLVDFDNLAKEVNVLHEAGKLPHVPKFVKRAIVLWFHIEDNAVL